jgi:hypothetical protein
MANLTKSQPSPTDTQGGGEQPFRSEVGRFAGGLTQIDRAPHSRLPKPATCPRYGDSWAESAFNPKSEPAGTFRKGRPELK